MRAIQHGLLDTREGGVRGERGETRGLGCGLGEDWMGWGRWVETVRVWFR